MTEPIAIIEFDNRRTVTYNGYNDADTTDENRFHNR